MWTVLDGPTPADYWLFAQGVKLAAQAEPAYNLSGLLYLTSNGYLVLSVPSALVRGIYAALDEPGVELPKTGVAASFAPCIVVMTREEVQRIGPDEISERGKRFRYSLGRLLAWETKKWPGINKVWFVQVHSPQLQQLRRSYGLNGLPSSGRGEFHILVAVRREKVLGNNTVRKH